MKKSLLIIALAFAAVSCADKAQELALIPQENFTQVVDGKQVSLYTLAAGDITMQVTNYGGRVISLWTPDRNGHKEDIVLGYETLDRYLNNTGERYLGACVGPVANRIGNAKFEIDGTEYSVEANEGGLKCLHSGIGGVDLKVWDVVETTENSIVLHYLAADGEGGFPGNRDINMTYTLTPENCFEIKYAVTTDAPTYFNISHHSFFNLQGEGNGDNLAYEMVINADSITPVDSLLIPTGEFMPVEGTPFDFREPHTIGERISDDHQQLKYGNGYDHNWVLNRSGDGVEFAASVYDPEFGRYLEVFTDQIGLQFYAGNFFDGTATGKTGKPFNHRATVVLETQKFPDSCNQPSFPSIRLNPGETYTQTCIYKFSAK